METYSMRQSFEVDLHRGRLRRSTRVPLQRRGGSRTMLAFEDAVLPLPEGAEPEETFEVPLSFNWSLPPVPNSPDLLLLAAEMAALGGPDMPVEVSAIDSFQYVTDPSVRTLNVVSRITVDMWQVFMGEEVLCDTLDRCMDVSRFLLESAPAWIDGT
ncbi:MAG: hypothetical protein R2716_00325 [Microthrixaceae bacterium]